MNSLIPSRAAPGQTLGVRSSSVLSPGISSHRLSFVEPGRAEPEGICACGVAVEAGAEGGEVAVPFPHTGAVAGHGAGLGRHKIGFLCLE